MTASGKSSSLGRNLATGQRKSFAEVRAYVGRVHDVEAISSLQQRLRNKGFWKCTVRHMGGDLVLMSSPDTDFLQSAVTEEAKHLAKVPLKIWGNSFFAKLTSFWGTFIRVDESTRKKNSFEMARVLVLMHEARMINDSVQIKVNDQTFSINVVKELGSGYVWAKSEMQSE
ncbi:hypothetical protein Ancab_017542 [Ancistrocladus abbreviatus]